MKKILVLLIMLPVIFGIYIASDRYSRNQTSVIPYPFQFSKNTYKDLDIDAPIVIIGDNMAERLITFKNRLAEKLSVNLTKPIKIQTLANDGDSIHRSLEKIKKLNRLPLILIYIGGGQQEYESSFNSKYLRRIQQNIKLYENDYLRTALMIYPEASRLAYWPVPYSKLKNIIQPDENEYSDQLKQIRSMINFKLYEFALDEFFNLAKKRNSLIIPLTTPLNLQVPPIRSCYGSLTGDAQEKINELKLLIRKKDFKGAYNISNDLALLNPSNAQIQYLHGQVLFKLNSYKEAQKYNELAIAFDCGNTRGHPVYNSIIKKLAKKHNFNLFDFHQYLVDESRSNFTFVDDIYPQDFYLEKMVDLLAIKIKKRLKL